MLLVGRLTLQQRARLRTAGITTIDDLAASDRADRGRRCRARCSASGCRRGCSSAPSGAAGPAWRRRSSTRRGSPRCRHPTAGDVFFDFEGDPLWTDDGRTWGLEYLFGVVEHDGDARALPAVLGARPGAGEARAARLPPVRPATVAAPTRACTSTTTPTTSAAICSSSAPATASARRSLDELLREHVLVDLYPIVLRSIRISERSYSLKRLEPLYMGDRLRESDVTDGAASVDAYVTWTALVDEGAHRGGRRAAPGDRRLQRVRLRVDARPPRLAAAPRRRARGRRGVRRCPTSRIGTRRWCGGRRRSATPCSPASRTCRGPDGTPEQTAIALAAAAIEYHRREDKSFWWEHYDREIAPIDDWAEQKDVLVVEEAEVVEGWRREAARGRIVRTLRLIGALAPGSGLRAGDREVFLMYDGPGPGRLRARSPLGQRGEHAHGRGARRRLAPRRAHRRACSTSRPARPTARRASRGPRSPSRSRPRAPLRRRTSAPRSSSGASGSSRDSRAATRCSTCCAAARRASLPAARSRSPRGPLRRGDRRATCCGSSGRTSPCRVRRAPGKTHVGREVIATLVRDHGWRIGVVAQSHAVVENLLDRVVAAGLDPGPRRQAHQRGRHRRRLDGDRAGPAGRRAALDEAAPVIGGSVVGGTTWTFTDAQADRRGSSSTCSSSTRPGSSRSPTRSPSA